MVVEAPPLNEERPVTVRVPVVERLLELRLVDLKLSAKKLVVVALVPVALRKVKF